MKTYIVTQIADAAKNDSEEIKKARELAYRLGHLRQDLWNKFGGTQAWGANLNDLLKEFKITNPPELYQIDFKNWDKTATQVIDDIQMTHAAIRAKVIKMIYAHYPNQETRTDLCNLLKTLDYQTNNILHRWVRNAFERGHTKVNHHIVICHKNGAIFNRKNRITEVIFNGLPIEGKNNRYEKITLRFKTGKVNLTGYATIIFHDDGVIRLHYPIKKEIIENKSEAIIGVDKGYSEALYGSDNKVYGVGIGRLIAQQSDWLKAKMQHRNKLHAIYKKTGNENIRKNNLGRKNLIKKTQKTQAQLKSIIRQDVRVIFSKYKIIVCEDLSKKFKTKALGKNTNRKLSAWCKGEIHKALTEIAQRTDSIIKVVNPAYTSQVDYLTGTLLGTRKGDCFIRYTGDVVQADYNAAMNILARDKDKEINRFTPFWKVKEILLQRTACFVEKLKLGGGVPIEGLA
jgi:IS605 OrfB family transposase